MPSSVNFHFGHRLDRRTFLKGTGVAMSLPWLSAMQKAFADTKDQTPRRFVAMTLGCPLLLEGEVGVGKTELAKVMAAAFDRHLIRLQCYEGIDTNQALYEWDYARQMLQIRALSEHSVADEDQVDKLFGPKFLLERPQLVRIVRRRDPCVVSAPDTQQPDDNQPREPFHL